MKKKGSNPPLHTDVVQTTPCSCLLCKIRVAKDKLREAKKEACVCSGLTIQYEGGCQCKAGALVKQAEAELVSLVESI